MIHLKRIYDPPTPTDGARILVDRVWPRGFTKERAALALWLKDVAPSTDLRHWFGHDPAKWGEFRIRYAAELQANPAFTQLQDLARQHSVITLVYSATDTEHNQAVALRDLLRP